MGLDRSPLNQAKVSDCEFSIDYTPEPGNVHVQMSYRLTHSGPEGVRFQRTAVAMLLPVIGTLFGGLFVLVSLGIMLSAGVTRESLGFMLGGVFFLTLPWYIARTVMRLQPQEIVFDNASACCYLVGAARDGSGRGAIPYASIEAFGYEVRPSPNGSPARVDRRTPRAYDVRLYRTDGSAFVLLGSIGSEQRAREYVALLDASVHPGKRPGLIALGDPPAHVAINRTWGTTVFQWKAPVPVGMIAFVVVFFAVFFGLVAVLWRTSTTDTMFHPTVALIGGVGVFVALALAVTMVRDAGATMFMRITNDDLTCGVVERGGRLAQETTLPLPDVVAVCADSSNDTGPHQLIVRTAQYAARVKTMREHRPTIDNWMDTLRDVWESAMLERALPCLETGTMPLAALVAFENQINHELTRRKGAESPFAVGIVEREGWWLQREHRAARQPLRSRLMSNELLGVAALLSPALPVLMVGLALLAARTPAFGVPRSALMAPIVAQFVIAALASYKLVTRTPYRVLGLLTAVMSLSLAYTFFALRPSSYSAVPQLAMSVLLMLTGWRLLSTPERDLGV